MFTAAAVLVAVTFGVTAAANLVDVGIQGDKRAVAEGAGYTSSGQSRNGIVEKTVVSSHFRLVFVVGLEGTGHHYFVPVLERVFDDNKDLARINACAVPWPYCTYKAMSDSPSAYARALDEGISGMRDLAAEAAKVEAPGTFASAQQMDTSKKNCGLRFSYPFGSGQDKVYQYVDVTLMAQAAEAAGVDLRLVYLQRSAKAIMLADGTHRRFQQ